MTDRLSHLRRLLEQGWTGWVDNAGEISGWARLLAPMLIWPLLVFRRRKTALSVASFALFSPYVFSPAREDSWMNRALRGETAWLKAGDGGMHRWLTWGSSGVLGFSMLLAMVRRLKLSWLLLLGGSALSVWHHDRMAANHVLQRERDEAQWRDQPGV